MRFILSIIIVFPFVAIGQKDTIQNVKEVMVTSQNNISRASGNVLNKHDVDEIAASDVGELIQKIAGANLKSYGSLGGLKTVSMRGLGANHSSIVKDGFSISNSQTGQVNLGQIQVDNVVGVIGTTGERLKLVLPVSAQVSGSNFFIKTFENTFSFDSLSIRTNFKRGSFGQLMGYGAVKYQPKKLLISAFGSIRKSNGDYEYNLQNGQFITQQNRKNNDYLDYSFGGVIGRRMKNGFIRAGYHSLSIDQGLPGAVIFYNNTSDERMETLKHSAFADYLFSTKKVDFRIYTNGESSALRYTDSTFLNDIGGIDVSYQNQFLTAGVTFVTNTRRGFVFSGGLEEIASTLVSNDDSFANPQRYHNFGLVSVEYHRGGMKVQLQASSQYVSERNNNGINAPDRFRINPFVLFQLKSKSKTKVTHSLWYRNSFRMASFNELYYNNIGNNLLEPEDAHQFNYSALFFPKLKGKNIKIKLDIYYNQVKNKILAIPTKNLFVWSMQNVGRSNSLGTDFIFGLQQKLSKHWLAIVNANYSYQYVVDVTDSDSPTYKHQIAYIPQHSGNFDVSLYRKSLGFRLSNYLTSLRYSLNENVDQNIVDGFAITDVSLFYSFKIKNKTSLKVQFNAKNIFDKPYSYIRSFVMPGRNYLISLSYAFN